MSEQGPEVDAIEARRLLAAARAELARWREEQRKRACLTCGRRDGEGILGFQDGSWYSPMDGYYGPDGKRLKQHEIDRLARFRYAPVRVKVGKQDRLCERCRIAKERQA